MRDLINELYQEQTLSKANLINLLLHINDEEREYLYEKAYSVRYEHYKNSVYVRGLIEFSNYCKNDCTYCGISIHNKELTRYHMTPEEVIKTAEIGYSLGFRTFVMQGGEDTSFTDDKFAAIISSIKTQFPEAAVTLSIGERSKESYQKLYDAGADRFLIRHETINKKLYEKLHPKMSYENRIKSLFDLKDIGFRVGTGFMVGVPGQEIEDIANDLLFIKELNPHMIGIGPFIPHKNTPLRDESAGSAELTYTLIAILRLMLPTSLIPSTTSLATLKAENRYKGFRVGANVVMPNLTPYDYKKSYQLYDGKKITDTESYEALEQLKKECLDAGFYIDMARGDYKNWRRK